jgi:hypothetical protein
MKADLAEHRRVVCKRQPRHAQVSLRQSYPGRHG